MSTSGGNLAASVTLAGDATGPADDNVVDAINGNSVTTGTVTLHNLTVNTNFVGGSVEVVTVLVLLSANVTVSQEIGTANKPVQYWDGADLTLTLSVDGDAHKYEVYTIVNQASTPITVDVASGVTLNGLTDNQAIPANASAVFTCDSTGLNWGAVGITTS
jgi:hypothetical protein